MDIQRTRFLAIGSGLAGLAFALHASPHGEVIVLTKGTVSEANTSYAQGGIAAAVGEADSWELHEQDTLVAGAGICDAEAVRLLVQRAPAAIQWLAETGAAFDVAEDGEWALGREGGHSRSRILHKGDATGWEIEQAVVNKVHEDPRIQVVQYAFVVRLLIQDGRCIGADAWIDGLGMRRFLADAVLLATGGCGKLYRHTTNPDFATGDGAALGLEAGAAAGGLEFMQFHPTALYHSQMRSFLITEAARGAGATLRNHLGTRFMYSYDPRLELAPRDVVARAMDQEMKRLDTWCLYLDMAHLPKEDIESEFPTITKKLSSIGIEPHRDWIPVAPAQHYSCGGITTGLDARTSIPGLYAAGEVANTGVHGANRLASNSLLEALVFAAEAAAAAAGEHWEGTCDLPLERPKCIPEGDAVRIRKKLQTTMTDAVGIVRTNDGLAKAQRTIRSLLAEWNRLPDAGYSRYALETHNLLVLGEAVVKAAAARTENVGLHYNTDLI